VARASGNPKAEETAGAEEATEAKEAAKPKRAKRFQRGGDPREIVQQYLDALDARDLEAATDHWHAGGLERISGIGEFRAPEGLRGFFSELQTAMPDSSFEILDMLSSDEGKVAVRWRSEGTFCGGPFQGIEPTGARVVIEGGDFFTVVDGKIQSNDVYIDGTAFARQVGLMPPQDSAAERTMRGAFNLRTKAKTAGRSKLERVADGVWRLRGGLPMKTMNVYLIQDEGGVTVFDAGISRMTRDIAEAGETFGGIKQVVLGHGHADHRGGAPGLGAPVRCHPAEVSDAEGDGGRHYFDFSELDHRFARLLMPRFLESWDGGPVKIDGTVNEGDEVAGFEVVHLPGHAPGMIGLWRESDRLALASDAFYTLDPETGRYGPPRVPHRAFNHDTEQARQSMRKLADLEPASAWPGHAKPLQGDVASQLRLAADTT
jgi:steroid delta-isomerase-like uncharacterized protein